MQSKPTSVQRRAHLVEAVEPIDKVVKDLAGPVARLQAAIKEYRRLYPAAPFEQWQPAVANLPPAMRDAINWPALFDAAV